MNQQSSAEIMFLSNASDSDITNFSTKYDSSCIFVFIVSIIGVLGNSFTIFAFQYAKLKKKYQFHRSWRQVTIFIWNLSLVDFLSSLNMTVLYVQFTFYPHSINNWFLCVSEITLRDIFVLISASSIACIAAVTMLGITQNRFWNNFCDRLSRVNVLIIFVWVFGFLWYVPKLMRITEILNKTRFENTFDCGTFFYQANLSRETIFAEFILHLIVFFIIIFSYSVIILYSRRITSHVESLRHGERLNDTLGIVLFICIAYILQCTPYMVCRVFFAKSFRVGFSIQFPPIQKISYVIYYTQFFPNIFIYVTRNESYRKAYVYWLKSCFGLQVENEHWVIKTRNNGLLGNLVKENSIHRAIDRDNKLKNLRRIEYRSFSI